MGGGGLLGGITGALFGSPSTPATPDYAGAAQQTAQGNLDAARQATAANRVNQITPYGSLKYAETGTDKYGNPTWTATTSLSPEMQQLFNYDTQSSLGLGKLQNTGLNYVENMLKTPFDTSQMTQYRGDIQSPDYKQVSQGPQFSQLGQAEALQRMGQAPTLGLVGQASQALGVNPAEQALRVGQSELAQGITPTEQALRIGQAEQAQGVSPADAMLRAGSTEQLQRDLENQGMAGWDKATGLLLERLEPSLARQQKALDTQLANQGIMRGSEAYNQAQQDLAQKQNDLRTQAALSGQQVQQNLFGQALQAGQFGNQAMTQEQQNRLANLGFTNTAMQQDYANRLSGQQLQNQAAQQNYANQLAGLGLNNQAIAQNFAQNLSAQQLQNQAAQQNYANQLAGAGFNQAAIQQNFGNAVTAQQLANQAAQQNYANQLSGTAANNQALLGMNQAQLANLGFSNEAAQQDYANRQAMINQQNTIGQQGYQNQLAAQQANNAAMSQGFANQLAAAQLANQARGQQFAEAGYLRNEPINTLNAIRAGSQVTGPTFQNVPLQATTAGADLLGAAGMTGNAAIAQANAQNAQQNAMMQGLFSLGGAALMSDIRTKENIKHLGYLTNGLPFYEFEYKPEFKAFGGEGKHVGVMAQEVEQVLPHAVIEINGYKVVNYGALQ